VLVLPAHEAAHVWVVDAAAGGRRLFVASDEVTWDAAGRVSVRASGPAPDVREYVGGAWRAPEWEHVDGAAVAASVPAELVREATVPSGDYGSRDGRQSAPADAVLDAHAAVYRLDLPAQFDRDAVVRVRWAGDVAQLRVDGVTATDRFWDGSELVANLHDSGARAGSRVELHVLPLRTDSGVHLPADAAARLAAAAEALCALDDVRIDQRSLWREVTGER
jgi:beta-galactosidase